MKHTNPTIRSTPLRRTLAQVLWANHNEIIAARKLPNSKSLAQCLRAENQAARKRIARTQAQVIKVQG